MNIPELFFYCSWPTKAKANEEEYLIFTILQLNRSTVATHINFNSLALEGNYKGKGKQTKFKTLLEAIVNTFANTCSGILRKIDPKDNYDYYDREADEIYRMAAKKIMRTVALDTKNNKDDDGCCLYEFCNTLSTLKYEGNEIAGTIITAEHGLANIDYTLELKTPIIINHKTAERLYFSRKAVRKLINTTNDDLSLICDDKYVYGVGIIAEESVPDSNKILCKIIFHKQFDWELECRGQKVMHVKYGTPFFTKIVDRKALIIHFRKIFGKQQTGDAIELWKIVAEMQKQNRGAMLVICSDAKAEAERLKNECSVIGKKLTVNAENIGMFTGIDGAILLDQAMSCYAIGVILDGIATKSNGNSARGSRYNSAVRYVENEPLCMTIREGKEPECTTVAEAKKPLRMAVVVSEDGDINLLPDNNN